MAIVRYDQSGLPWGVYTITYYRLFCDGSFEAVSGDDNVTSDYVLRMATKIVGNQALHAVCRSQPGGLWSFGGEDVERAAAIDAQ
jgi:hypothetical protein